MLRSAESTKTCAHFLLLAHSESQKRRELARAALEIAKHRRGNPSCSWDRDSRHHQTEQEIGFDSPSFRVNSFYFLSYAHCITLYRCDSHALRVQPFYVLAKICALRDSLPPNLGRRGPSSPCNPSPTQWEKGFQGTPPRKTALRLLS
jgi:hypothetical protein